MRNILFIFLFIPYLTDCHAQIFNLDFISGKEQEFNSQVKQLDQFLNRFNNKENIRTGEENEKDILSGRKRNKVLLLNYQDSTLLNTTTEYFINYICDDSNHIQLDYNDDNWYAKVSCSVQYKGKEQNIFLILKNEGSITEGFKWVICGIHAPFIDLNPLLRDTLVFIGPMNNELGFMGLHDVFNDNQNISEYAYKNFKPDYLSVFFFMVKSKEIQYLRVNSIQYHFLQIKNWIFTIDYFNRPSNNSGWLISTVINMNDSGKIFYKENKLYLR